MRVPFLDDYSTDHAHWFVAGALLSWAVVMAWSSFVKWLKAGSKKAPVIQVIEAQAEGFEAEDIEGFEGQGEEADLEPYVNDGWVSLALDDVLSLQSTQAALAALTATVRSWGPGCNAAWFDGMRYRAKSYCIKSALTIRERLTEDKQFDLKRRITASGIAFGFEVPQSLWLLDPETIVRLLKYLILTNTCQVEMEKVELNDLHRVPNFPDRLSKFIEHKLVKATLFGDQRLPCFEEFKRYCVNNKITPDGENPIVLKKLLTAAFLTPGLSIPLDYLYIDIEISDFVRKVDQYEVAARKKLSIHKTNG